MGIWLTLFATAICAAAYALSMAWGDFSGWRGLLLGALWLVFSIVSMGFAFNLQPRSWLSWNGHEWKIHPLMSPSLLQKTQIVPISHNELETHSLTSAQAMTVHWDFQNHLCVSLINAAHRRQWFWLSKASFPDRWHGFRCAVYSRSENDHF